MPDSYWFHSFSRCRRVFFERTGRLRLRLLRGTVSSSMKKVKFESAMGGFRYRMNVQRMIIPKVVPLLTQIHGAPAG